jgi:hypothetical protein
LYIIGSVSEWITKDYAAGEGLLICPHVCSIETKIGQLREYKENDELWAKRITIRPMLIGGRVYSSEW